MMETTTTTKRQSMVRILFFWICASCLIDFATSSSNNYNIYNYDSTTPQFTPDGRLLQVEYASSAAELSSPVVALQYNKDMLILMTLQTSTTQSRIVQLETTTDNNNSNVCIVMSGVLADSIALLQVVLKQSTRHLQNYKKSLTAFQVAAAIADACQRHAFGGGIRPYGSTMLICGYVNQRAVLYQTDPSGAILDVENVVAVDPEATNTVRWIVGGSTSMQRQLRKRLASNLSRQRKQDEGSVIETMAVVARTLIKESQQNLRDSPSLEIVILSPILGSHRLDKRQIAEVLKRI